jgi:hypothetical protein
MKHILNPETISKIGVRAVYGAELILVSAAAVVVANVVYEYVVTPVADKIQIAYRQRKMKRELKRQLEEEAKTEEVETQEEEDES